jgi:arsenite-transporting ATPase
VLGRPLEPGRIEARCADRLTVEELDAEGRARAWLDELRGPLGVLFERGSYLDEEDVARFTALRLPGIDEVMGALRLLELADAPADTVVIDTAPTGHTLRLLDAGAVLDSWSELLEALAGKAGAVAGALTGGRAGAPGADLRARIRQQLEDFPRRVLGGASCVLVTRAGGPVAAESARLAAGLGARGLPIQATVNVGPGAAAGALAVPWLDPAPRGCAGLRAWRAALATGAPTPGGAAPAPGSGHAVEWLHRLPGRLVLFAGKGGVGKSTCAAAAALVLGERRPVLLLGADPAGSLEDVLERKVGTEPVAIAPGLRAAQIDAAGTLASWREDFRGQGDALLARLGLGGDPALDRRVLEAVWNLAPPGMDELVALSELLDAVAGEELIVLDAAPTGHLLRLLALPATAQDWTHAAMRTLLKYGVTGELDALAARLLAFARQLKDLRSILADAGRTGTVVVTLAEPVVRAETERLVAALAEGGIPLAAILTNRSAARSPELLRRVVPQLRAPAWPEPPRGITALRQFVSCWELQ